MTTPRNTCRTPLNQVGHLLSKRSTKAVLTPFFTSGLKRASPATLTLKELEQVQTEEYDTACRDWTPFIGLNLRAYMQHPWSSTQALQACAEQIGAALPSSTRDCDATEGVDYWKKIQANYEQGNKAKWMTSWAGIFISALRTLRMRALMVARHLSLVNSSGRQSLHPSEVSEDIGTAGEAHGRSSCILSRL